MPKVSKNGKFLAKAKAAKAASAMSPLHAYVKKSKDEKASGTESLSPSQTVSVNAVLSRGQRKRNAKREQYLKRENMVLSSLRLRKLEEQKGQMDGLDALREALPTAKTIREAKESKAAAEAAAAEGKNAPVGSASDQSSAPPSSTNRSKKMLGNREITHMNLVLDHPSFQENPFAAIQEHLRNTLAPQAEILLKDSLKRTEEDEVAEAKKKEAKKERLRDARFENSKYGRQKKRGGSRLAKR